MNRFFKALPLLLLTVALFCACAADKEAKGKDFSEGSSQKSSAAESEENASLEDVFQKYPVDSGYGDPEIDLELTKRFDAEYAIGVRYLEGEDLYILTINSGDNIQSEGGMLIKLGEYDCSNGSARVIGTARGYFDSANPFILNKNSDGSVCVLARNKIFVVEKSGEVRLFSYDNEMYSNGDYSFDSGKLACYADDGEGNIILINPKEPKTPPVSIYSNKSAFSFLAISPNGEKTAFLNNGRLECYSEGEEKLFETEEIELQSRYYWIRWLDNEKLLFVQNIEEQGCSEGFIFDGNGKTEKSFKLDYCLSGLQNNIGRSYPYMLAGCFLPIGKYGDGRGDNYGIVLINLDEGNAKLLRNTGNIISSYDISNDGKTVFWIEDNSLFTVKNNN